MHLVDQLAAAWGVIPHSGGKTVWFELTATGDAKPDGDPPGPGPGGGQDGDVDLDALLESLGATPPAAIYLPDTDVACGTYRSCPDAFTTAYRRRIAPAA